MDINNNEQYKQQQQLERHSLTIESYNLGNKSRSMPALGSSTRSLHADDHHDEDDEDEINYNEDEIDLSIVGKSASWACPREEINHPMYSSYSNGSIFDPPKYLPNPNSTLPPRGTFTRGPWHNPQPTLPKSPSLLFTVQFKSTTDTFSLLPTCPTDIHVGDFVKVEGDRGLDIGVVSEIYSEIMDISFTKKILCLATQEEIHYSLSKEKDEIAAVELCRALVARRGLSICIVDAEFQCDRKKLTFFFTSDRHTDFRELVRDLFATFKTRIWMQKIKAPVGHSHTPQLIRRPLPPTHPSPPYSLSLNSGGIAESQPLYNVPRSLQSRAFMGSGADYPNRPPQTESIHARMYPSTMIDPNHEYTLNSTSEFSQSPRNIVPLTSSAVPLQPLNVNNNGSNINGNINGTQQPNGRQSNSFLKPLVNRFKQLFHSPNQDEQVIDEYLHNGFGVSQNGYSSQYEAQQQQQQSQLHSISPSTSGSYQSNFLYPADDIYRGTSQLSNNSSSLSLPLDSSSITLSSPTATQDTLSIFSASHINMSEMSVLPQTTSIASSISSSNNNNNNINNSNNNINLNNNNNNMSNLNIISNPTVLSPTSSVSSLSKSQFNTTQTFQTPSHIDENLWLANVVAHQPSDPLISSSLYNQSINQRSQNNIPPPPISSPSYRSSSGDISDQTLGLEQYNITNSLSGLSISAEPFVYRGSTIHMG